jgi:hypothetical protein
LFPLIGQMSAPLFEPLAAVAVAMLLPALQTILVGLAAEVERIQNLPSQVLFRYPPCTSTLAQAELVVHIPTHPRS